MKTTLIILVAAVFFINSATAQVSFGKPEKINASWKFKAGDIASAATPGYNDQRWEKIKLPHDWSVEGQLSPTLASCTGYLPGGIGWYRKSIDIPVSKKGEKIYLYFEGVYNRSEVFLNGQSMGKRPNGYISFMYDATPYVEYGKENVIAVRVDHSKSADSRWYTGSGIYRDVWLVYANPVHIAQWGVYAYPEVKSTKEAFVHVEVEMENGSATVAALTVQHELLSPDGKVVASASKKMKLDAQQRNTIAVQMKIKNPQLWDLNNPVLYSLHTKVIQNGQVIDENTVKTGIRSFSFDPDKGFALNGQWMKVKGVCLHHDAGVLGAASYKEVWRRRLIALKETGVNAIRTSHNPQATHLYELCDELGLLVKNEAFDEWEFPKRKWLEGWNVGTPGFQGSYDFFESWGEQDLADMVRRDRNHISIFAWSIGNEVDYPNDPYSHPILDGGGNSGFTQPIYKGYKKEAPDAMRLGVIAKKLVEVVKKYDTSRPVTAGLAGVAMSNETEYPGALDIAGYNYTESRYDADHAKYPARVIFGSENRHDLDAWKAVRDNDHIFGQFLWTGIDYLGESGKWPSRGFYSGLLDLGGFVKPRGYFRKSLWSETPMAYIGTYPTPEASEEKQKKLSMDAWPVWNYNDGKLIRVVCYTNTAKAKLLLNGKVVGDVKSYDDATGIIVWDIPYQDGKLEVVGMDASGIEQATSFIQSSGRPYALQIISDNPVLNKEEGIAQVVVQVVDEKGIPVMLSEDEVTCHISGPASLLGLEASNNKDMSDYTDNKHRVFHGRILAYIQANGTSGQVKVKFTAPWLKTAETILEIK
jgi:hypothetical protein